MKLGRHILIVFLLISGPLVFAGPALVIIDMQYHYITRDGFEDLGDNEEKLRQVLERLITLIEIAKSQQVPIILIETKFKGNYRGPTHQALIDAIGNYKDVRIFIKTTDGMLDEKNQARAELENHLNKRGVTDLVVTGANGTICVKCSILGALRRGYRVWADRFAIIDFNYSDFIWPFSYLSSEFLLTSPGAGTFEQPEDKAEVEAQLNREKRSLRFLTSVSRLPTWGVSLCTGILSRVQNLFKRNGVP
jgi:nicotinamidase-related amidase